jgi:hypothetical protein
MQAITTIGLDIAKSVFQVHGIDAEGKVVTDEWLAEPLAVRIPAAGFRLVWLKSLPRRG